MLAAERELSQEIEAVKNEALYGIVYGIVHGSVFVVVVFVSKSCRSCLQHVVSAMLLGSGN